MNCMPLLVRLCTCMSTCLCNECNNYVLNIHVKLGKCRKPGRRASSRKTQRCHLILVPAVWLSAAGYQHEMVSHVYGFILSSL